MQGVGVGVELFKICGCTCMLWFRHVTSVHAVSLKECFAKHTHTCTHTHQCCNGCSFYTLMCIWYIVSHDMHVTPSSLQGVTLPSAVETGLSKCTTLQKLTVRDSPPSVTAALLNTLTVIRSLGEVTLYWCNYGT